VFATKNCAKQDGDSRRAAAFAFAEWFRGHLL